MTMTVTCDGSVICDVILAPNSKSKIKINGKENENENENENKVHYLQFWQCALCIHQQEIDCK